MKAIFLVFLGSGLGGSLRYALSLLIKNPPGFPLSTFVINILACFLLGIASALLGEKSAAPFYLLFAVGFCGGFSTFSTFALENFNLLSAGQFLQFGLYNLLSISVGLFFIWLAIRLCGQPF